MLHVQWYAMAFLIDCDRKVEFPIPKGETIIGRGPYLKVKEQILSRSHAVLAFNDGVVKIRPTHSHPTYFYNVESLESGVPLAKDEWKDLEEGNCISLLPSAYKYHIKILPCDHSNTHTDTANFAFDSENGRKSGRQYETLPGGKFLKKDSAHHSSTHENDVAFDETLATGDTSVTKKDENVEKLVDIVVVSISKRKEGEYDETPSCSKRAISPNKKRRLPAWMCQSEAVVKMSRMQGKRAPKKTTKAKGAIQEDNENSPLKDVPVNAHGSDDGEKIKLGEDYSKIKVSLCDKPAIDYISPKSPGISNLSPQIVDSPLNSANTSPHQVSNKGSFSMLDASPSTQLCIESPINSPSMLDNSSDNQMTQIETSPPHDRGYSIPGMQSSPMKERSPEDQIDTPTKKSSMEVQDERGNASTRREADVLPSRFKEDETSEPSIKHCPYGKRCFRKNPAHFQEYSHPASDESEDDNVGDDNQKSECPYGMDCYRQDNPHHTKEFSHNLLGKRKRRTKNKKSLLDKESDNDGENEYDLNDSFMASSDGSSGYSDDPDDSDYDPHGRKDKGNNEDEDDADTDVDELVSEAKGFIKNRRM